MLQNGTKELKGVSLLSGPISWRGVGGLGRGGGEGRGTYLSRDMVSGVLSPQ